MKTKNLYKKILVFACAFLLMFLAVFESVFSKTPIAFADEQKYTNVLDDLGKDENFDINDYPAVSNDYSLQVIQIAESEDKELFVYVYQPSHFSKDLIATTIRLGTPTVGIDTIWKDYNLTLVSTSGLFDKYKVEEFVVKNDMERYYDIVQVTRAFDESIDKTPDTNTENTISQVPYAVEKMYKVTTAVDGTVTYRCKDTEVVTITSKVVGFIRYYEGFKLYTDYCDSHFIAFSCDYEIDSLMEADVYYVSQKSSLILGVPGGSGEPKYGDEVKNQVTLSYTDIANNDADGWFSKKYEWNRIESVSSFLSSENVEDLNLSSADIEDLKDKKWILRFTETDVTSNMNSNGVTSTFWTRVSDVSILRLKFETDGLVYNLGVVDNFQTGSEEPFAIADSIDNWLAWLIVILFIIFLIIIFPSLLPVIINFFVFFIKLIFQIIVGLLKFIFKIIKGLFVGIKKLFTRRKEREQSQSHKQSNNKKLKSNKGKKRYKKKSH